MEWHHWKDNEMEPEKIRLSRIILGDTPLPFYQTRVHQNGNSTWTAIVFEYDNDAKFHLATSKTLRILKSLNFLFLKFE